ncbi:MmgE/PrpD family protein [Streptomyces sp. NPDC056983]|uniref:MmgE/PrpD family protein n=1 Tax=Streptomyces sp. NPDC056983 TaxID=3345987 RepID=UPI00362F4603
MSSTLTSTIGSYAAGTTLQDIPAVVVDRAKQVILDELACAHFGRRSIAGDLAARYATQLGGPQEARIYATGSRVAAPNAALANGAAGHGEEVDGAHVVGGHPGASIVHAAMAVAERQRSSGADLVTAVVLGYDIGTRVVQACGGLHHMKDRFGLNSDFLYALGCAVASGRLIGLDATRHCHAMALSTFASNALVAFYAEERHISKSLTNGQIAAAGVNGALMAAAGLEGHTDIVGAPYGVLHAWGADDGRDIVAADLGERYTIMGANFKFMNAGYPIHAPTEAVLALIAEHGIKTTEITSVDVGIPSHSMRVVNGRSMRNICLQDMLSAVIVRGGIGLRESPFPEVLSEPEFTRLQPLIKLRGHPDLDRDQPNGRGSIVTITTADGASVTRRVEHPNGHSERGGATWPDLRAKWQEGLPECDVDRLCETAQRLDELDEADELLDVLRGQG